MSTPTALSKRQQQLQQQQLRRQRRRRQRPLPQRTSCVLVRVGRLAWIRRRRPRHKASAERVWWGGGGLFLANASESARSWDWPVTALAASVGRAPLAQLGAATGCIAPRPLPVCWSAAGAPLHNYPTPPPSPPPPLPTSPLLPFFSLSCRSGSRGRRLWWWWPQWTMTGAAGSGTWQRRFVGCLVVVHLSHAQAVQTRRRWLASPRVCAMGPLGDRGCSFLSARVGC